MPTKTFISILLCSFSLVLLSLAQPGCTSTRGDEPSNFNATSIHEQTSLLIREAVSSSKIPADASPEAPDLKRAALVFTLYHRNGYVPVWSHEQSWLSTADSLKSFIENSRLFGLFPEDYHAEELGDLQSKLGDDSVAMSKYDPQLWSRADLLLSDAFMNLVHDVKLGRIPADSLSERKLSNLPDSFYIASFDKLQRGTLLSDLLRSLEPRALGYRRLKAALPKFLSSIQNREFTNVPLPSLKSSSFRSLLQKRLFEGGYIAYDSVAADSMSLAVAIKKFQEQKGLTADGVAGEATVRKLNMNDRELFVRIAISMDKYKLLPDEMPARYIWVNASANFLELVENGDVKLYSKVICGRPKTRTPLLTSSISELITYPQWVPPPSIVSKEILPAVKKNPSYLRRKGFSLQDRKGNEVDPDSVDWSKYETMPFRVVQGSGDANSLGIMKFVFANKYSVYLHDTNQRYLFGNEMRNLSHGCVRVQEWEELARRIIFYDSPGEAGKTKVDSMNSWLQKKQKRSIAIRNALPVYIRYFTCEGTQNGIDFFDDVYGEDRYLKEKYFAGK
jgi:murein L,D-transpeptidase YcbB/YkuD